MCGDIVSLHFFPVFDAMAGAIVINEKENDTAKKVVFALALAPETPRGRTHCTNFFSLRMQSTRSFSLFLSFSLSPSRFLSAAQLMRAQKERKPANCENLFPALADLLNTSLCSLSGDCGKTCDISEGGAAFLTSVFLCLKV